MPTTLSIVVLTHNDENRIVNTLECLGFSDELIVVDDNSTERTLDLVKSYTSNIFKHSVDGNFASQRNFAMNHAHGDWILFIDSDEVVSDALRREILASIRQGTYDSYFLKRIDYMWGKKILHGEVGTVKLLRLAKKGYGKWHGKVHEVWRGKGQSGEIEAPLIHAPHQSVKEFVSDVDEYSTLRSQELYEKGTRVGPLQIVLYPVGKFFINYVLKKGYKDGIPGFLYAAIMSFHSFLVRAKLFQKSNS